jgi:hexosaminidase
VRGEYAAHGSAFTDTPDGLFCCHYEEVNLGLLPQPRSVAYQPGNVLWRSPLRISVQDHWRWVVETFSGDLAASVGWRVEIVDDEDADIQIVSAAHCADEHYEIRIEERTIIGAISAAGVSNALTVLRQMGPAELWSEARTELEHIKLPRVVIMDGPRYSWRGVHLDVARHFWDVGTVCRLIDQLAAHRLNMLHLHLNDDQGWRVEVPGWPRLTQVGSMRRSSPLGRDADGLDDNVAHGGFYTAQDLLAIGEHAAKRCVRIVPEIDLPGHAQAVVASYPHLGNAVEPLEVWTRWGISEHVLNPGPAALDFAEEVVCYVASLFPDSPMHIGGDECPVTEWEASPFARSVMEAHGFTETRQLQGLFTQRLTAALQRNGHEVLAWDEVLDAEVSEATVISAWRRSEMALEAARRGHDVIMAPMQYLYFDWPNSVDPSEPIAIVPEPCATTWEKVYSFSVTPPDLEPQLEHHVRGAQAQLWSEYITTRDHLDYMAFPRLCALGEVTWGTNDDVGDFRSRLTAHLDRLSAMGVAYRPLDPA